MSLKTSTNSGGIFFGFAAKIRIITCTASTRMTFYINGLILQLSRNDFPFQYILVNIVVTETNSVIMKVS